MATDGFDFSELTKFDKDLLSAAQDFKKGKHTKQFLRKSGNKLKKSTLNDAKSKVKKKSGKLFKGIKRGKPYNYKLEGSMAIRVYGSAPHTHLINNGHRYIDKQGKENFVEGKHFMEAGLDDYKDEFIDDINKFIDDMLDNHGL